ncbi:MAG: phosphoribosylformylglycinamidine cyclo-ligase [Candidatus Thermoplasmatota archaeon]|nr:phosphoribosylformylglycinamidine cyclo-ligase [Candidatus Thermoplasmatota archaeon]
MDYAKAGVDIAARDSALTGLIDELRKTMRNRKVMMDIGHYANLIEFGDKALALSTDGVGTKVLIAKQLKDYTTIGIDCVAMNVNDVICVGAEPIAMVDYITIEKPDERILIEIATGLRAGADEASIAIVGGETAIMPEVVNGIDLAGTCLGIVDKDKITDGSAIEEGDVLLGLESNGIHSNGLTLARKVLDMNDENARELLKPTRIYVRPVLELLKKVKVKGLAHITGGGIRNLKRLKRGIGFEIDNWPDITNIFLKIMEAGVSEAEMFKTFNMGIGFCIVVSEKDAKSAMNLLKNYKPCILGRAVNSASNEITLKGLSF